jgi:sporulation protein YlmC with PRC-barrel domain
MNRTTTASNNRQDTAFDVKAGPTLLSAATITGDDVVNMQDESLGTIQDIMLDIQTGKIRYAVLSSGGFLGMGDRLFAIPWNALKQDKENKRFMLDVDMERLKKAPGFDKDHWPNMADEKWNSTVESYYATRADAPRADSQRVNSPRG